MGNIGMIISIGHGGKNRDSLVDALKKSIVQSRPDVLSLVYSSESKEVADILRIKLGEGYEYVDYEIINENNVDRIFSDIVTLIDKLIREHSCELDSLTVDFTSGTKAMSSGVILAAVSKGIETIKYIAGQRKEGIVQAGLEEIITLKPTMFLSHYNMRLAIEHFKELRFSTCLSILKEIPRDVFTDSYMLLFDNMKRLAEIYQSWDIFDHRSSYESFRDLNTDIPEIKEIAHTKCIIERLQKIGADLKEKKYSLDILADLYNNAQRRILEGKYDDAAARLYRLTEMCAQFELHKKNINTSKVKKNGVPESFYNKYKSDFNTDDKAKLGLQKAFELLIELDNGLGKEFQNLNELKSILQTRNNSILAHGIDTVNEETCRKFSKNVLHLLKILDKDFEKRSDELQFPWIRETVI